MNGWVRTSSSPIRVAWWAEIGYVTTTIRWCIDFPIAWPSHRSNTNTTTWIKSFGTWIYELQWFSKREAHSHTVALLSQHLPRSRYGDAFWLLLFFDDDTSFIIFWAPKPNCINVFSSGWKWKTKRIIVNINMLILWIHWISQIHDTRIISNLNYAVEILKANSTTGYHINLKHNSFVANSFNQFHSKLKCSLLNFLVVFFFNKKKT